MSFQSVQFALSSALRTITARWLKRKDSAFEESPPRKFRRTVTVIRARARLSLLVRWSCAFFHELKKKV